MRFLLLFLLSGTAFGQGTVSSTCIWSGSVADCLPSDGLLLRDQRDLRLGEATANGSNYVALQAPSTLAADVTLTLPADDGNNFEVLTTDGSGALDFAQITSPSYFSTGAEVTQSLPGVVKSAGQLKGTNTNDAAATGYVGEIISNNGAGAPTSASTANAATSGNWANIASASLTAGEWDVSVTGVLISGGGTFTANAGSPMVVTTTSTPGATGTVNYYTLINVQANTGVTTAGQIGATYSMPSVRFSFASTTTIYVHGNTTYSSTLPTWAATIVARRIR
jgi:hypothetical protein